MIRRGYEKPRSFTVSNMKANVGGWQNKSREYGAVTPPRPRKTLRRSSSFSNDVDIPPLSRQDRALIPAVPRFEQSIKSQDVKEGAPACLTCKVFGNPFPTVSWLRNRKALSLHDNRIKDDVDEDGQCSLNFRSVLAEDRGSYTCVAINHLGKVNCSALLNVHIAGGFPNRGFSSVKAPVTNAGRRETKIQKGVASHRAPGSGQNSCGESIKSSDSGISRPSSRDTSSADFYPVFSDNISSSSQAYLRKNKETSMGDRAPQFSSTPRSKVVEEGHSVLFQCHVEGAPKPLASWYKGNSKLKDSERIVLSEKINGDCSLEIVDLKATDAGSYRCVAMNRAGKSSVSVELMLAAKAGSHSSNECPPSFSQPLTDVDVNEGSRARFECKVDARPKPTVEWMKDGELITASSRVRIMEVYGTHSLVLSRTDHGDTGTYTINASNHVGSESCSAQLRVKESSYSSRGSTPKGLRSGHGSSEVVTPTYSSSSSPATSAMSSPSMSPKLGRAINSRPVTGSVTSPWSTDLKSRSGGVGGGASQRRRAPGFILRPRPQTVAPGEKLVLKCTLLGHPKPNVTWDRDGCKLDESDDRIHLRDDGSDYFLELADCSSSDSGKYTVSAKNSLGKQSATVDIIVSGTGGSTGKNRTTSSISVSRTNHHDISDSLNNNNKSPIPRNIKSQRIEVTINSKNVNTATNENRESERKHPRDFILPPHSNKEDVKPSSTSSYSSYTSSVSRMSTSSSRSASSSNDESPSHRSKRSKQVAPTFTRRLSSTQVLEGEELELNCEITGSPTPEMTWTRNGLPISQRDSSSNIEFKDGVARLKVSHIQSSQAGEYVCLAKNELGNTKCSSRVTVKPKPKQVKPKFTRLPKDIRISEGETLSLEAEVSGQPTAEVLWSLDGQEISNGECTYRNNIAKLILHDVTLACSGQYMCTAINDAGEDYAACRVRIKQKKLDIPPEFTAPLSDVKTKQGDDVCLRCMVTGIPEPRVQWLFNDEVLDGGEGIEITYHDGVAALTLDMATAEDTGCYSCIAVNTEGKSTTSCQVVVSELSRQAPVVKIAPEFVTRFEDYIRAMEGDCVTLTCKVKGTPDPEITWKINDKVVRDAKISFENGQASFVLDPISSDHAGNVVCLAKNSSGQTKHEGRLYVRAKREAPCFVTQLAESVEVQEGKEVTFGGQIKGHPQPRVSWTRNGRSLSVLNTETSYEEGKASVRIRKAGTSDAGRYVCTARNLSGETESSCMVTVVQREATQKPEFKKKLADMNLNEGQDIRLVCEVTGLPIPAISWVLDGQKLEEEDGEAAFKNGVATMLMEDAMTEDSGVYECVAKNSEGEARTRCNVKVTSAKKAAKPAEEGPSFPIQLEDMTINENEDIVVSCQVKGNPKPTITWLLDGEPIPDAECKYSDDGNAQLFLPEALPEDEGVYTCIAQNHLNRVMCSCKVTVKAIPKTKRKQTSSKEAEPSHVESKTKVETSRPSWSPKKSAREMSEVESPKTTPTSSRVNINGKAEKNRKYGRPISSEDEDQPVQKREGPDRPPKFIEELQDITVPDGSINYKLVARVSGMPPPSVKWYVDDSEIEESDEFRYETDGDKRILIFAEIFPEDSGTYTCVALNSVGEVKSKMKISVEEIDGDPPIFILKPRPLTVNAGDSAVFTCKVDGEPVPTLQWLYCNQPIAETERITITPADAQNNYIHSLEVQEVRIEDAGRYAACCKNLLGDITCTVSMIVNAPKNQEEKKDFRNVLKHSASTKSKQGETPQAEQVDFRGVLKRQVETNATPESNQAKSEDAPDFREALSRPVRTKVLTEEERKLQRAEQKDFRANLVRKVDTKTVTNEVLKVKSPSQKDFRDEALKTKVKTKEYAEDVIKQKHAEQKDFRSEALKTKVTTKAYKEENMKAMRAEQVDFREVLSPTNKRQLSKEEMSSSEAPKFELSGTPAKMKLNKEKMEHNTVATRRTRARGGVVESTRRTKSSEEEVPKGKAPVFSKEIKDKKVNDATPFELVCHVVGNPQPKVSWFLGDEEIQSEADISITREGGVCKLAVAESFPDDEGTYLCRAENEYGVAQCSAHVTVVTDGELECEHDN